jgi:hypothetical protein
MYIDFNAKTQRTQRNSLTKTIKHFAFFASLVFALGLILPDYH